MSFHPQILIFVILGRLIAGSIILLYLLRRKLRRNQFRLGGKHVWITYLGWSLGPLIQKIAWLDSGQMGGYINLTWTWIKHKDPGTEAFYVPFSKMCMQVSITFLIKGNILEMKKKKITTENNECAFSFQKLHSYKNCYGLEKNRPNFSARITHHLWNFLAP